MVTPVFEDWVCLRTLVAEISKQFTGSELRFDVYAIDDCSSSDPDLAGLALPPDSCIRDIEIVRLAVNLGHQRAIAVGLSLVAERSDVDAVLVMDCDGEDRPADIAALVAASLQHPGRTILARRTRRSESLVFRSGYALYKRVFRALTGHTIDFGNYSLLPLAAVRRLVYMPELWNNLAASVLRSRVPCLVVPTVRGIRYDGSSRMNWVSLVVHGLSAMSVYSDAIFVRLLLAMGLIAVLAVVGIVAIVAIRLSTNLATPGWATTVAGDLLIILSQSSVIVVAASLTMLAGRSNRPIIPLVDSRQFIAGRKHSRTAPDAVAASPLPSAV